MSFKYLKQIPSAEEIKSMLPLPVELGRIKKKRDEEIISIFTRQSEKFLVIIGPCSAHDEDAVCDYVARLAKLQEKVKEKLVLVPRIYTNKPRTIGKGYKGMVHQPDPKKESNIVEGIKAIRKMHIRAMKESHLTSADEMLYPANYTYLEDILSYVAIGARSVENQQHRLTVSGLDIPVGMKNPTSGDLDVMFNSIQAAQFPHIFIYTGWEVSTPGNSLTHAILRGSVNQFGQSIPNYHYEDLMRVTEIYNKRQLENPTIIIDTNHANSNKQYKEQSRIAREIIRSMSFSKTLKKIVKGLMIESFITEGAQDVTGDVYGKSITDPCLGWEDSEKLVLKMADNL
jgi:3-deoxy-7-phosphoheptulonate synthase